MLKVLQVRESEGLWIIENIFQAGFEVETHRHTGPVYGYTQSGAWKYKEYDYVNRAGSFLYEPAGSVHTLTCIEDNTRVWFQMYGVNINLDAAGNITGIADGAGTLAHYLAHLRGQRPRPVPTSSRTEQHATHDDDRRNGRHLRPRDLPRGAAARALRRAAPHPAGVLAGHPGPARLLGGAQAQGRRDGRPQPAALLGLRGRGRPRGPRRRAAGKHARHAAGDGPAAAQRLPAPDGQALRARR